ncbi:MAG: carbohydrate ABC transporter permease [Candidatus Limiplasma sp.]|nr:carbohydrate ABC transporter permease [Candidatus Limiplasma sp.]
MRKTRGDKAFRLLCVAFVTLFAAVCLYPLVLVLAVSLSDETTVLRYGYNIWPRMFSTGSYQYIFQHSGSKIFASYRVTITTTVVGTLLSLLITSMISFALSIRQLRYRNVIAFLCNFTIVFSAGLIPWYIVCVNLLGLKNNLGGLIVPSLFSVWNMFLLRTYFSDIPPSLFESATLDGAGYFTIFARIAVPLSKTALLTVGMMYALSYWNDWWNALMFIEKKELFPLQYLLYNVLSNVNAISAGKIPRGMTTMKLPSETIKMTLTMVTIGPIIFLYPFIQKYFVSGIMSGAVKE